MGYTHYWYRPAELDAAQFAAAVEDFKKLLPKFEGITLADGMGEKKGKPTTTKTDITFNGYDDGAYETFQVQQTFVGRLLPGRTEHFAFCKTAQKPYDFPVMCALLCLKHHLGDDFKVATDGEDSDWQPAYDLVNAVFGWGSKFTFAEGEDDRYLAEEVPATKES